MLSQFGPKSFRARLTLTTTLVIAALLIILGIGIDWQIRQTVRESVNKTLKERAKVVIAAHYRFERRMRENHRPFDRDRTPSTFRPPQRKGDRPADEVRMIRVLDSAVVPPEQDPYDTAALAKAKQNKASFSTASIGGESVLIYTEPVLKEGKVEWVLQIPYNLTDIQRSLDNQRNVMLAALPVSLILIWLAGAFVVQRAIQPIHDMKDQAAKITAEDLSGRLPIRGQDEFSELGETINGMLARLEESFAHERSALVRLQQVLLQQQRFTADASHELKTPLAVIKTNAGMILYTNLKADQARPSVVAIDQAASRMGRLVQDLLALARIDSVTSSRPKSPIFLANILQLAKDDVWPDGTNSVEIDLIPNELMPVLGYEDDLRRVFVNLLDNARQHGAPPIRVSATLDGNEWCIRVADAGPGIPSEHLDRLFDRFYRVDASRTSETGGSGLGLAIVKGLVEAHRGRVSVSVTPGQGTAFVICLPSADRNLGPSSGSGLIAQL